MDASGLISAWWMPKPEEELWEITRAASPQKIVFLTGVFVILNSLAHSLVRLFFDSSTFTPTEHVWLPHRIVEFFHATVSFGYSLYVIAGWADGDNTFWKDRVFAFNPHQEFLTNLQIAYHFYSIGVSLFNFRSFRRECVFLNVVRGGMVVGLNYLYLSFPCILGARLRVYWNLLEVATSVVILTNLIVYLNVPSSTLVAFSILSLLLSLVRFWVSMFLLLWAYLWVSSENIWGGVPEVIPVSKVANAYLSGTGIGAVVLSYLMFVDFRAVIQHTREWTELWKQRCNRHE